MVLSLLSLAPLFVVGQLVWIHTVQGEELRAQGLRQAQSQMRLPAKRGNILDRAGRALVVNTPRYDLAVDPTHPGFEAARAALLPKLSTLTGLSPRALNNKVRSRHSARFVRLAQLSEKQWREARSWDMPGMLLQESFTRQYNYNSTAAHVLGHTDVDGVGKAGLELEYDEYLTGAPGRRALLRDRRGHRRVDAAGMVVPPRDGQTLVLTIDLIRQTILEEELARGVAEARARHGTAVAVDPRTGAILALANVPSFDPNHPQEAPVHAWRNRAVTDRMEPGSSFKLVGAVAALDLGVTTMERIVDTGRGSLEIFGRTMRDTKAHGIIPFRDVIAFSSNVGMAKTARRLRPANLYQYARNLGFGQRTGVDLPGEVSGVLKKIDQWSRTTLTSMSIGYDVDVTAIQLLMAYAALANGGLLVQPYVVAERRDVTGKVLWRAADDPARSDSVRRVFSPHTAEELTPAFIDVVRRGTARQAQVEHLSIAGKTGTARKATGGYYGTGYRATFVGFYPADDPQVAMVVVLDEPTTSIYGGAVSAPVFKRVAERWIGTFPSVAEKLSQRQEQPAPEGRPVPDVRQLPAATAARRLRAAGFRAAPGAGGWRLVLAQDPAAGALLERGMSVGLRLAPTSTDAMPELKGLSAREANYWLAAQGVRVRLEGRGRVVGQSQRPGTALPEEVVLQLE